MPRNRSEKWPVYSATEKAWLVAYVNFHEDDREPNGAAEFEAYHAMTSNEQVKWRLPTFVNIMKIGRELRSAAKQK